MSAELKHSEHCAEHCLSDADPGCAKQHVSPKDCKIHHTMLVSTGD